MDCPPSLRVDPKSRAYTRKVYTAAKNTMERLQARKLAGKPYDEEQLRLLEVRKHLMELYATQDG